MIRRICRIQGRPYGQRMRRYVAYANIYSDCAASEYQADKFLVR